MCIFSRPVNYKMIPGCLLEEPEGRRPVTISGSILGLGSGMPYQLLADTVVLIHIAFVVFAVVGGVLAMKWRWVCLVYLPAVLWAAWIEFTSGICPLTPLENWLRSNAGQRGYQGGFIEHYIMPVLYPSAMDSRIQIMLGVLVVSVNVVVYGYLLAHSRHRTGGRRGGGR